MMPNLDEVIEWVRSPEFGLTLNRDKKTRDPNQEFFTPTNYIKDKLNQLDGRIFVDPSIPILDNMMGSSQILSEVLIKRMQNGICYEDAIQSIFGLDISEQNVIVSRKRMSIGRKEYRDLMENNFRQGDALKLESFTCWKTVIFGNNLFSME